MQIHLPECIDIINVQLCFDSLYSIVSEVGKNGTSKPDVDMDAWIEEQDEWRARNTQITPIKSQRNDNTTSSSSAIVR